MKLQQCLKLFAIGAFALGATASLSKPSQACPTDNTSPNCSERREPVVKPTPSPVVYPHHPGGHCPPQSGTPCGQPPVYPQKPVNNCQMGMPCGQAQPPMVKPPIASDSFFCDRDRHNRPTTFAATSGGTLPIVRWVSHYFAQSGYDPETRCQEVSGRFDLFYRQGRLNYVTTGIVNRLPVVCVASQIGGPCTGVLFTLKPDENASRVIQQLFDVRAGASGSLYESESRQYIDIKQYMNDVRSQSQL
ncbi:MAG: COP23 domain-containing protein [Kovacikia sp.]